ncbi:MAG: hypothetical protein ACYST0_08300 [Planctomycetota bacterium]
MRDSKKSQLALSAPIPHLSASSVLLVLCDGSRVEANGRESRGLAPFRVDVSAGTSPCYNYTLADQTSDGFDNSLAIHIQINCASELWDGPPVITSATFNSDTQS